MWRSTDEASLAVALEVTLRVRANGIRSAGVRRALVQVFANGANGFETVFAEALALDALCVVHAVEVRFT